MADLRDLYQEFILDHSKKPRNFQILATANRKAEGFNPLCGDKITVYLQVEEGRVKDISFQGSGCAISTASASVMTEQLKGKTADEIEAIFKSFHEMVTGDSAESVEDATGMGKLAAFSGVRKFPIRVKCATLAWHTLRSALAGKQETVTTE